jgi:hypothetical protein
MSDREVLIGRIERSLADIRRARHALDDMAANPFVNRMQVRFEADFTRHANNSLALLEAIRDGKDLRACWRSYVAMDSELRSLLDECVSLLQGTMDRQAGLDDGICDIADALLEHLCHLADAAWRRFTVLGSEYLTERTGVVRVRFPAASIWDLPLIAHEFGHVIEPSIIAVNDDGTRFEVLARFLGETSTSAQKQAFLREHYADIMATYAVGPMFGWAIMFQQFDPISAFDREGDLETHPSAAKRMHVILRTLESMDQVQMASGSSYGSCRAQMMRLWDTTLAAGHKPRQLPGRTIGQLDRQQADLFRLVDENLPKLRYVGWNRARSLAANVAAADPPPVPDPALSIVDVLNAAWVMRLAQPEADVFALRSIGAKFEKICQLIPGKAS